jgi:hypothetical protein
LVGEDETMRRFRWTWNVVLLALVIAAFVAQRTGRDELWTVLTACWVVLAVGGFVLDWRARRRPGTPVEPPEITAEQADEVRGERDRAGEIAAIKRLRTLHPTLSLLDAKNLTREL